MKLPQLFKEATVPPTDFESYLNPHRPSALPPLDTRKLALHALTGRERSGIMTPYSGTGTLLIRYKGKEGGLLSIDEQDDGETWDVTQVQGAKTKKSYRVATGLKWHLLLGRRTHEYATHPESEVRQVTMPLICSMQNIEDARSENVNSGYGTVRSALGMRWSEELGLYIADTRDLVSQQTR